MKLEPLELGPVVVRLVCPDCGELVAVTADLQTVRHRATDEGVTLRLKCKTSKVPHLCGQGRFDLEDEDG